MVDIVRVDGRYALGEALGITNVFRAQDIISERNVAIKLESVDKRIPHLEHEYILLNELQGIIGLPRPLWLGREGPYRTMLMDLLGPSLYELHQISSAAFPLCRVAALGLQIISRIERIDSDRLVIHRNISPQNILMGLGDNKDTVFLIDFSIAKHFRNPISCIHIPMREHGQLVGTPAFTSINSHLGLELSRRDDLEALAYTLLYLYKGSLPWLGPPNSAPGEHRQSLESIQKLKEAMCSGHSPGLPTEFLSLLSYARNLAFTQKPDYEHLRSIFVPVASPPDDHSEGLNASDGSCAGH